MQNENKKSRFAGKGYYIALIACIAAVGISGYVFVQTARQSAMETMAPAASVTEQAPRSSAPAATPSATPSAKPARQTPKPDAAGQAPTAEATAQGPDLMEDAYEPAMGETAVAPVVMWPIQGEVVAVFSRDTLTYSRTMADWRTHEGLDIAAEAGSLVTATQDGTVTAVYRDDYLGNVVVVSHNGDLATLYANLTEEPAVAVGDKVLAGEVLGQVGSSALLEAAESPHLHFEVYEGGQPVDPQSYLP